MFPSTSPILPKPKQGRKLQHPDDPVRIRNREAVAKCRDKSKEKLNQLKELREGFAILHQGILDTMSAIETQDNIPKALGTIEHLQFVIALHSSPGEGM